ncbi:MAG: YraN family protein, partial [Thermoleophilia bacterium]|nr:YraN family protein [Thermoleophilia bacterium]
FLCQRGYEVLAANARTPGGELDLLCRHGDALVVVEVKTRAGSAYGAAVEAVDWVKTRRLRAATSWWLAAHPGSWTGVRFDVITVALDEAGQPVHLRHIPDVFEGGG